jgi:two-component system NarL family sensor kinase
VDEALTRSAGLLRSTVSELHPAVLAQSGLARAIRALAANTAERSGLAVTVVIPPAEETGVRRDPTDLVVYSAVREVLANVVKHAQARTVTVELERTPGTLRVTVTDDGRGVDEGAVQRKLAAGHIGVASHRAKVEAVGGRFTQSPASPRGTRATLEVPNRDAAGV